MVITPQVGEEGLMSEWNHNHSAELYGLEYWGQDLFGISTEGELSVYPKGKSGPVVSLYKLTQDLLERGIRLPLLIRFSDILEKRIHHINQCFENAINEYDYKGRYLGVYPIKVNQQRHLVEDIVRLGHNYNLGLECGSKPELLIALAMVSAPDAHIVCNGFKDSEYIETALLSQKLGRRTFVVVDRFDELGLIIKAAKKLNIQPHIGFRCKLNHKATGRWSESSGARSKFGLTPSEILEGIDLLNENGMINCLELVHFHIGSQIPSIQAIKSAVKEGSRFYTEIKRIAPNLNYFDVGGGLGVDYDGSGKSDSSTNYSEQEYSNDVVSIIQQICDEKNVQHPNIITESGRAIVAHSTMLVCDVVGKNILSKPGFSTAINGKDSPLVRELFDIYSEVKLDNVNEFFNDLVEKRRDTLQLFTYGVLGIEQRAKAEDLYWATLNKISKITKKQEDFEDIYNETVAALSDTYFCNLSVFQSLPDAWAVNQLFPVMPIHKLNEKPRRRATLVDLTCDSDGKLDQFINVRTGGTQKYLRVHDINDSEPYYLGIFITGAYQEILGDLHNLFGDTDAVHVSVTEKGYTVDHVVEGDSVSEVINYVQYNKSLLSEKIRLASEKSILENQITRPEARLLLKHYEEGLSGYTYFEHPEV